AEEGLALARQHADEVGIARCTFVLGLCAFCEGALADAERLLTDALARFKALNDRGRAAYALSYLASIGSLDAPDEGGDPATLDRAATYCEEALRLSREIGYDFGIRRSLHGLAYVTYKQRDFPRSLALSQEVLAMHPDIGWADAAHLEDIADIAGRAGAPEQAARLYGAADALRERFGRPIEPAFRTEFERDVAVARRVLGDAAFATAWAAGQALSAEQAAAEALSFSLVAAPIQPDPAAIALTRRERDILPLVVAGLSDRAIGEALFISDRTVETHLAHIYAKLGVRTRAAASAAAIAAGLVPAPLPPTPPPQEGSAASPMPSRCP
ncbi:MAG: LuxR C-terminal-related transcriptional regulator, partial [Thermomicrobiales bacterium]